MEEVAWACIPLLVTTCSHLKTCWYLVDSCLIDLEGQEAWLKVHELASNGSWQEPRSDFAALAACCCLEVPWEQMRTWLWWKANTICVTRYVLSVTGVSWNQWVFFSFHQKFETLQTPCLSWGGVFSANLITVFLPCSYAGEGQLSGIWILVSQEGKCLFISPSVSDSKNWQCSHVQNVIKLLPFSWTVFVFHERWGVASSRPEFDQ